MKYATYLFFILMISCGREKEDLADLSLDLRSPATYRTYNDSLDKSFSIAVSFSNDTVYVTRQEISNNSYPSGQLVNEAGLVNFDTDTFEVDGTEENYWFIPFSDVDIYELTDKRKWTLRCGCGCILCQDLEGCVAGTHVENDDIMRCFALLENGCEHSLGCLGWAVRVDVDGSNKVEYTGGGVFVKADVLVDES